MTRSVGHSNQTGVDGNPRERPPGIDDRGLPEVRESEARHRLLLESWAQAMWETDAEGVVVNDSPSWRAYTGQTLEEWLGYGWLDAIHPDDRAFAERQWREATATRSKVDAEFRLRSPDGGWRWTNVLATPLIDSAGHIEKWLGLNIDIDARKRAETALRESEDRQAFLLDLSDALRGAERSLEIEQAVVELLGRKLGASRVFYATIDEGGQTWSMRHDYSVDGSGRPGCFPMSPYQLRRLVEWEAGTVTMVSDSATDPDLSDEDRTSYEAFNARAAVGIPLVKGGRFAALLVINQSTPRILTDAEIALARDAAERTWAEIERSRAEEALRDSEVRQAFLLRLSDSVRSLADAAEIQATTTRLLGEHLGADRVMYAEVEGETGKETGRIHSQYVRPSSEGRATVPFPEHFTFGQFGEHTMARRYQGEPLIVADVQTDPAYNAEERGAWEAYGVRAAVVSALAKGGRLVAEFGVHSTTPRTWREDEIALIEDVAERTWAAAERARAEGALRESEERYRALFESMDQAYAVVDVLKDAAGNWCDFRFVEVNPAFLHHTNMPPPVGKTATELLGSPNPRWTELYGQALDTGEPIRVEESEPTLGLTFDLNIFALDRSINRVAVLFTNITTRKNAEEALRDSEEQLRLIVDGARDYAIFTIDPSGTIKTWQAGAETVFGWTREEAVGQPVAMTFTPEDRAAGAPTEELETARRTGSAPNVRWHLRKDGRRVYIEGHVVALRNEVGAVDGFLKIGQDTTEKHRANQLQATLLAELQHRVRNILAMVRSIIRRSLPGKATTEEFAYHLEGRVDAMSRTQTLLTRVPGESVDLEELIQDELQAQAAPAERFRLAGEELLISAKAAEVITLALHELATNSIKYGVLGQGVGHIDVRWRIEQQENGPWVLLEWEERGARPVARQPDGFGSELILRRVPYDLMGESILNISESGVLAVITFPRVPRPSVLQTTVSSELGV